jgi:enoyl-CoA hydratase/carnithine racemase
MSTVRLELKDAVAVVRLDKARGNAIDPALVADLKRVVAEAAGDEGARGLLLASAHPKLFCPGLDLVSLSTLDRAAMEGFMLGFAEAVWALYGLRKPMLAAVNGAAVAGGCILAMTADYRILKRGAPIGLNEVKVGVPLPWSVSLLLRETVHTPALSRIALLGRNFSDEEALAVGLADEVLDADGFEEACLARLAEFAEKDAYALGTTKAYLRAHTLAEMRTREHETLAAFLDGWFSPATQERIHQTVASLTARG